MVGAVQRLLIVSPIGMHLVLTLGKLGEIAPLEWERVPAGLEWEGTRDPTTSASCVLKNPHGPLLRPSPPRFHDSIIKDSPDRTPTFQQHMNSLPVSIGGQLQIILWNGRGLHQHVIRLLFDNTEQLFNMSPEPWLLLLAAPLSRPAHRHMIRSVFKFARLFCHHNPSAQSETLVPTILSAVFAFSDWLLQKWE